MRLGLSNKGQRPDMKCPLPRPSGLAISQARKLIHPSKGSNIPWSTGGGQHWPLVPGSPSQCREQNLAPPSSKTTGGDLGSDNRPHEVRYLPEVQVQQQSTLLMKTPWWKQISFPKHVLSQEANFRTLLSAF